MDLAEVFDQITETMRADIRLARSAVGHEGIRGAVWEETIRRFLRSYLPASLDVSTSMLIDSYGGTTRQLDIVISDAARTPVLFRSDYARVIPVECAFAVIEVKQRLTKPRLLEVFDNMASVYALRPVTVLVQTHYETIRELDGAGNPETRLWEQRAPFMLKGTTADFYPLNYFVFAYDSQGLDSLGNLIREHIKDKGLPLHRQIDMVCVLEKGLICYQNERGPDVGVPEPGTRLHVSSVRRRQLGFYMLMAQSLFQARTPNFDLAHYVNSIDFNAGGTNASAPPPKRRRVGQTSAVRGS